jgi:hypothetical protein
VGKLLMPILVDMTKVIIALHQNFHAIQGEGADADS